MRKREKIQVLLADDTLIAREGWKRILDPVENINVVGEAETVLEVRKRVAELLPDIVLMDLNWMGDEDAGWTTIQELKTTFPGLKIIAVTAYEHLIKDARRAGADAALTKTFTREQLLSMIEDLASSEIKHPILSRTNNYQYNKLTRREMDVLRLLAKGKPDKYIAETLGIAESTAKNQVKNILSKLGVRNRTEAANKSRDLGLTP